MRFVGGEAVIAEYEGKRWLAVVAGWLYYAPDHWLEVVTPPPPGWGGLGWDWYNWSESDTRPAPGFEKATNLWYPKSVALATPAELARLELDQEDGL